MASTPEGKVKAKVNKMLAEIPRCYRFMPVQNGMGTPGLDYYLCINGHFVAIETKTPGKDLTPRQKGTRQQIEDAGGLVLVVKDDETLVVAKAAIAELIRGVTA
jgi:hypothetical protein